VTEIAQTFLGLSKPTDMTIHWNFKALEEHFPMGPLVFRFSHFRGENALSEFFSKKPQLPRLCHHQYSFTDVQVIKFARYYPDTMIDSNLP
jgi:hypothetical protein